MPAQPSDEWTFLRPEEFADDDAVERVDADLHACAEESAVHVLDLDESQPMRDLVDAGEAAQGPAQTDDAPVGYFDDEEPESDQRRPPDESDQEPGVDDILMSQHYTFDRDGQ